MSDEFKETEADRLVKGETWGLMTMDLFGMVGLFIYFRDKYSNTSQGMNIPDIQIVCQWHAMLPSISMIWQQFGQCIQDPTLQGFVYLLVEKEHFDAECKRVEMAKDLRKQKWAATLSRATKSSHTCAGMPAKQVARPVNR